MKKKRFQNKTGAGVALGKFLHFKTNFKKIKTIRIFNPAMNQFRNYENFTKFKNNHVIYDFV